MAITSATVNRAQAPRQRACQSFDGRLSPRIPVARARIRNSQTVLVMMGSLRKSGVQKSWRPVHPVPGAPMIVHRLSSGPVEAVVERGSCPFG
jgi:hypothetical protein